MVFMTQIRENPEAVKFDSISFEDVLKGLNVMDTNCFTLSQENKLPIFFDMNKIGNLKNLCWRKYRYKNI
jgi:uridylate kinase